VIDHVAALEVNCEWVDPVYHALAIVGQIITTDTDVVLGDT